MIATLAKPHAMQNAHFSFQQQDLAEQLVKQIQHSEDGYWQHQFDCLSKRESTFS